MSIQLTEGVVQSADATTIGYMHIGSGPALVFVHGSLTTGEQWLPVATGLAERFSCFVMDRRGRGRSKDSVDYSLASECADIQAVLNVAGPEAMLVGHSYGAICTLEAANRFSVPKLILYEPPLPIQSPVIGPAFQDFCSAVEHHEFDKALTIGLKNFVHVSEEALSGLKNSSRWSEMAALTPTWVRECEVMSGLDLGVERFADIRSPTLLLLGTETAPHHALATRALKDTLPNVRCVAFQGEGHFAHLTATASVVSAIIEFLDS